MGQGEVKPRSNGVKPAGPGPRIIADDDRDDGAARECSTGRRFTRGLWLRLAGNAEHLMERTGGAGVA